MEKKLIELFKFFDFTDLIGFAKLLEVLVSSIADSKEKEENWEALICETIEKFSLKGRKERRELLKLAKEIKKENLEIRKQNEEIIEEV